jgi:hypothetical protein
VITTRRVATTRSWLLAIIATALGLAIAGVDARPTWDDTGITAGAIFGAAFIVSIVAGRWPWLWAVLVGIWVPAVAIVNGGDGAAFLALLFAFVGAYAGHLVSRLWRRPGAAGDAD